MELYPGVQIEIEILQYDRDFPNLLADPEQMPDIIQLTVNEARYAMLAIAKSAVQPDLAWEYLKFLMGESGEEAVDFVVNNTLERAGLHTQIGHKPLYEEIKSLMRREIVLSPPATFDLLWYGDLYTSLYTRSFPGRPYGHIQTYTDMETAKKDLALWAQEIEAGVPLLSSASRANPANEGA